MPLTILYTLKFTLQSPTLHRGVPAYPTSPCNLSLQAQVLSWWISSAPFQFNDMLALAVQPEVRIVLQL